MSSVIYFLSDAHLGTGPAEAERLKKANLAALFGRIKADRAGLYILGDLFDFWFEYRTVVHKQHLDAVAMLRDLRDAGVRITFLAGNHDFWAGPFFTDELGIRVVRGPMELVMDGKRFWLAHGDGLERGDWGYKYLLKPLLRNPVSIWLYSLIHPDLAIKFALWLSRISRNYFTKGKYLRGNRLLDVALARFSQGFDYVILGHCHRPELTSTGTGTYLNLGDFFSHFTYGVYRGGVLSLERMEP
jgi:UDP-2,3-diacylglucosamine hydrolase